MQSRESRKARKQSPRNQASSKTREGRKLVKGENTETPAGNEENTCSVNHCLNPPVTDGYCDVHLERLELIKESYDQVKQMQLRAREDAKEVARKKIMEIMGEIGEPEADAGNFHIKMDARTRHSIPYALAKQTLDEQTLKNLVQISSYMVLSVNEN